MPRPLRWIGGMVIVVLLLLVATAGTLLTPVAALIALSTQASPRTRIVPHYSTPRRNEPADGGLARRPRLSAATPLLRRCRDSTCVSSAPKKNICAE